MTMLMLHGISGGAANFDLLAPLVPDGHALDMPGYGAEPRRGEASFPALADWLCEKMDAMGLETAALFGHSFGGMLALEMAATHPDRVSAIVLCATTPAFGGKDDSFKQAFLARMLGPLDEGATMAELGHDAARGMMAPGAPDQAREIAAHAMGRTPEDVYRDIVRCLTTFNRRDDLERIETPALSLAGDADMTAPAKTMRRMAEAMPNGRFAEIPGGHLLPLENPKGVAEAIETFRRELDDAAG